MINFKKPTNKTVLLFLVVTAFSVFAGYLVKFAFPFNLHDGDFIGAIAAHFADNLNFDQSVRRAPLYPFLLGIFFMIFGNFEPFALILLHSIFLGLIAVVIYKISLQLYMNDLKALFISVIASVNPIMIWYIPRYYVAPVFIFLFLLSIWFAYLSYKEQKLKYYILFGITIALTSLTKAVMLLFPLYIGIALFLLKLILRKNQFLNSLKLSKIIQVTAVSMILMLLLISPWTIRNKIVSGRYILISSNSGVEFFRGNSYALDNSYKINGGLGGGLFSNAIKREDRIIEEHGVKNFYRTDHINHELDSIFNPLMFDYIFKTPGKFAVKIAKQIPPFWYLGQDFKFSLVRMIISIMIILVFILGIIRKPTAFNLFIILTIIYLNLIYAATISVARYSLPLYPLMLIPGSYFIFSVLERIIKPGKPKAVSGN